MRDAVNFAAQGSGSMVSPGASTLVKSLEKPCGRQTPDKSGLPSAVFGVGACGAPFLAVVMPAFPASCATAGERLAARMTAMTALSAIKPITMFFFTTALFINCSGRCQGYLVVGRCIPSGTSDDADVFDWLRSKGKPTKPIGHDKSSLAARTVPSALSLAD